MPVKREKAHQLARKELESIRKTTGIGVELNAENMADIKIEFRKRALEKGVNTLDAQEINYPHNHWGKYVLGNLSAVDHIVNAMNERHNLSLSEKEEEIIRKIFGTGYGPDLETLEMQKEAFTQLHELPNERGEQIRAAVNNEIIKCYKHAYNSNNLIPDKSGPHPADMYNSIIDNSRHFSKKLPEVIDFFNRTIAREKLRKNK